MKSRTILLIAAGLGALLVVLSSAQTSRAPKDTVVITRLYTGTDGQTHSEEVQAKFTTGGTNDVYKLLAITGAELHRAKPGSVQDWHNAPRRQYIITLSGQGEVELAGGKKIHLSPGHIELAEDTTGKGHITRVIGNEDRITLALPLADQSARR